MYNYYKLANGAKIQSGAEIMESVLSKYMRKILVLLIGIFALSSVKIDSQAVDDKSEKLTNAVEFDSIEELEEQMLSETTEFLENENIKFNNLSVSYLEASKVYIDSDISITDTVNENDIMDFLKQGDYVWVIPVYGIDESENQNITITVAKALPYDENKCQILSEEEKQLVREEAGKWGISEIGISENIPYAEQMKQIDKIVDVDHYTIVGGLKGMFQPVAIGFKNGMAKYVISLGYDYELLQNRSGNDKVNEGIYDYKLIREKMNVYKETENVSGGGNSVQQGNEYNTMLLMICLFLVAMTGIKLYRN